MTKEALILRVKALGWTMDRFSEYVGVKAHNLKPQRNIPEKYARILILLEENKKLREKLGGAQDETARD